MYISKSFSLLRLLKLHFLLYEKAEPLNKVVSCMWALDPMQWCENDLGSPSYQSLCPCWAPPCLPIAFPMSESTCAPLFCSATCRTGTRPAPRLHLVLVCWGQDPSTAAQEGCVQANHPVAAGRDLPSRGLAPSCCCSVSSPLSEGEGLDALCFPWDSETQMSWAEGLRLLLLQQASNATCPTQTVPENNAAIFGTS